MPTPSRQNKTTTAAPTEEEQDLQQTADEQAIVEPDAVDAELTEEAEDGPAEPMVRYTGAAAQRQILAEEWAQRGITGEAVFWTASNGHAVPKSQFTEEQLRVLSGEQGFEIEE